MMEKQIKILHISPEYRVIYFLIQDRCTIKSSVSLLQTIDLLKKEQFDLILSEPQGLVILTPQTNAWKTA